MSRAMLDALSVLNDRLVAAQCIGEALELAAGEDSPAWVFVYSSQVRAIREAAEALETICRASGGAS